MTQADNKPFWDRGLLTFKQIDQLRDNGWADFTANRVPVVRVYDPTGSAQWLVSALQINLANPLHNLFYGLADLGMGSPEIGIIDLDEAEDAAKRLGCPLARDDTFDPQGKTIEDFLEEWRART